MIIKEGTAWKKNGRKSVWERNVVFVFLFELVKWSSCPSNSKPLWNPNLRHPRSHLISSFEAPQLHIRNFSREKNSHKKKQRRNFILSWTNCYHRFFSRSKWVDLLFSMFGKYLNSNGNKRSNCEVDSLRATTTWNRRGTQPTENVKQKNQTVDEYSTYHQKSWLHTQVSPCYSRRSWVQCCMIRVAKV